MTETVPAEPYRNLSGLTKGELRTRLRKLRAEAVSPDVSLAVQRHVIEDPTWAAAGIVALYVPFGGEVDTTLLQHMSRLGGKQLWLPRCLPDAGTGVMEFAQCQTPHLRPGTFGIMEPDPLLCPAAPDDLAPDLVLIPAIAFDRKGYRLGSGGGYYDRFLATAQAREAWAHTRLLGLVPEKLVVPALPRDTWDRPVHGIATEQGVTWL